MAERPISSQRPYLLRAMHEWMTDNALTPHIVVDASASNLEIPTEHVRDGKIVLNVSYEATRGLLIGNDSVVFEARFNGVPRSLYVPIDAVLGIYARENGQGMIFSDGAGTEPPDPSSPPEPPRDPPTGPRDGGDKQRPALKVVK
ncbi:MAG: ClpXP protease specificity-enhancing factor [Gammaproteobacteria bacterium]|nr:ClpXP protease specificity-enhancing factor [Gammaproteobacteria bacterium]